MFHEYDLRVHFADDDDLDDSNNETHTDDDIATNPVGSIVAAIHKQQSKKNADLQKNII